MTAHYLTQARIIITDGILTQNPTDGKQHYLRLQQRVIRHLWESNQASVKENSDVKSPSHGMLV